MLTAQQIEDIILPKSVIWTIVQAPWIKGGKRPTEEHTKQLRETARMVALGIQEKYLGNGAHCTIEYQIVGPEKMDKAIVVGYYLVTDGAAPDHWPHPLRRMEWEADYDSTM